MTLLPLLGLAFGQANKTICVDTQTSYTDLHPTADFFVSNIDRPLRGVQIELMENFGSGTVQTGRTATTGTNKGCVTFSVSTTAGETYRIRMYADQEVSSASVTVHDSSNGIVWYETLATAKQFALIGGNVEYTVSPSEPWSILAVTGWGLHRTTGGLGGAIDTEYHTPDSGGTLHLPTGCSSECIVGDAVYMGTVRARKAYVVAYSLGFTFFDAMGGIAFDASMDEPDYDGGATTKLTGLEHLPAALATGYAHLYSGIVFNDTTESDCALTGWHDSNWDILGPPCYDEVESMAPTFLSCATGRAPLGPPIAQRKYYENMGYVPPSNSDRPATAIDVVRMWWDLLQNEGLTFADITSAYDSQTLTLWATYTDATVASNMVSAVDAAVTTLSAAEFEAYVDRHLTP